MVCIHGLFVFTFFFLLSQLKDFLSFSQHVEILLTPKAICQVPPTVEMGWGELARTRRIHRSKVEWSWSQHSRDLIGPQL